MSLRIQLYAPLPAGAACGNANGPSGPVVAVTISDSVYAVPIQGLSFSPTASTVRIGTTVKWTNQGGAAHTATSNSGTWDSGQLAGAYNGPYGGYSGGGAYQYTFTAAGTYPYHCSLHPPSLYPGFTGTSTVTP